MTMQQSTRSPAHYSTRADLDSFPARSPLERSEAVQTTLDCLAVLAVFLFVTITGLGISFALFCLFFVSVS